MASEIGGSNKGGFDFKSIEDEARKEMLEERTKKAKGQIKTSLQNIAAAEQVLANAKRSHDDLMAQIKDGTL